ncbi:MAG: F0F1 ATP synthase subunit epsilon [Firmicutes bacterium]|nr:F0F1 ATP synthase subunit epsilon [Bacillota bacterium]
MTDRDRIFVDIVTPDKEVFRAMVESLNVPTACGMTGILANHAPLLTVVTTGILEYKSTNKTGKIAVGNGFMEVKDNEALILVQCAEMAEDIDEARAKAALERAKQRLEAQEANLDKARAEAALARAVARLKAIGKYDY